jgi:hypothetical protein
VFGEGGTLAVAAPPKPARSRAEPRSLGVWVEYTIQDELGVAEVGCRYPFGIHVVLAEGTPYRVDRLEPGMRFRLEEGGVATVTQVKRPDLWDPPDPRKDKDGNSLRRVVGTFRYTGWVPLIEVTYGGACHRMTPGHLYWSETRRGWHPIGTFGVGEMLRTPDNERLPVQAITPPRMEQTTVYNVEVDEFHTYFVGGGRAAWSHNGGPDGGCGIPKAAMAEARAITKAIRDDAKIARAHKLSGSEAQKALRKGDGAHVFDDAADLAALEQKVWTEGQHLGRVPGGGQRGEWDRFVWQSPTPIGRRIQTGKPDLPLTWVEIKGKIVNGDWVYHLVPRPRPAGGKEGSI